MSFLRYSMSKNIDLEISVKSQSRSLKVVPLDRLYMVSYYCPTVNFVREMHCFQDIRLQKCRYLEKKG